MIGPCLEWDTNHKLLSALRQYVKDLGESEIDLAFKLYLSIYPLSQIIKMLTDSN